MQGEHLEPSVLGKIDVLVFVGVNPIERASCKMISNTYS